jgi:hypothetical protein
MRNLFRTTISDLTVKYRYFPTTAYICCKIATIIYNNCSSCNIAQAVQVGKQLLIETIYESKPWLRIVVIKVHNELV